MPSTVVLAAVPGLAEIPTIMVGAYAVGSRLGRDFRLGKAPKGMAGAYKPLTAVLAAVSGLAEVSIAVSVPPLVAKGFSVAE
jgi:hypothetical protein